MLRDSRQIQEFSTEDRMKWAKGRETSREADVSYCLFGLLDASIPAIYGEGRSKAYRRLLAAVSSSNNADLQALPVATEAMYDPLPEDWPVDSSIQKLVSLAIPLFIFAFTICRFIAEADPKTRLADVLKHSRLSSSSGLERTYLPILDEIS